MKAQWTDENSVAGNIYIKTSLSHVFQIIMMEAKWLCECVHLVTTDMQSHPVLTGGFSGRGFGTVKLWYIKKALQE